MFDAAVRSIDQIGAREIQVASAIASSFADLSTGRAASGGSDQSPLTRHVQALQNLVSGGQASHHVDEIRALLADLQDDRTTLFAENVQLQQQQHALAAQLRKLAEYEQLLARVDELVTERAAPADALLAVRLRRRDVLLNMAVANQAQASTAVLTRSNADLIRALRSAETTAHAALDSAQVAGRDDA